MIRPLTHDDLPALVAAHVAAFAGTLGGRLGPAYARDFARWFIEEPRAVALAADQQGALAGYLFGAPHGLDVARNRALRGPRIRGLVTHPALVCDARLWSLVLRSLWQRLGSREHADPHAHARGECFALVAIGVAEAHRGQGVAQALLAAFDEAAAQRGFRRLILDVHASNAPARRRYESCGWNAVWAGRGALRYEKWLAAAETVPPAPTAHT